MADTSAARDAVLGNVRRALGSRPGAESGMNDPAAAWAMLPRAYRRSSTLGQEELLHLLEDRLRDYDAGVYRCLSGEIAATVARVLETRGKRRMAVPGGLDTGWTAEAEANGVRFVEDTGDTGGLDGCDGVLTGASVAVAQTGSVVLQNVPGQGRRAATLLPDYHLCVLRADAVVETLPEAMRRLEASATLPMTFFSGPSATADIEMTRIKGVHGPRFVDVVLVLDQP